MEIGLISSFASNIAPTGWLKCNGAAISRATYASLFTAIGTTFGSGDGSTTFNVPDLRGEFIRGWDDGRGVDSGRSFGSYQADEFKSHTHSCLNLPSAAFALDGSSINFYNSVATTSPGNSGGTETRPRNKSLLPCIKY